MSLASHVSRDTVRRGVTDATAISEIARLRGDYGATFAAAYSASVR